MVHLRYFVRYNTHSDIHWITSNKYPHAYHNLHSDTHKDFHSPGYFHTYSDGNGRITSNKYPHPYLHSFQYSQFREWVGCGV